MRETVIIAGCTRSGTSLCMQMLNAGGFPCLGTYPAFEDWELGEQPWDQSRGHAVKLVDTHHQYPPDGIPLRIIRMRRNLIQQAMSINKFVSACDHKALSGVNPSILAAGLSRDLEQIDNWARQHLVLFLDFEMLIDNPRVAARVMRQFLEMPDFDIEEAASVVVPRSSDCYPTLLELELLNPTKPEEKPFGSI